MVKVNVEIEDVLEESIEAAKESLKEEYLYKLDNLSDIEVVEKLECGTLERYFEDVEYIQDSITEIADTSTPIYTSEIEGTYYLHSGELEDAYKDAGIYDVPPDNYQQVCICIYIENKLNEYNKEITELFDDCENKDDLIEEIRELGV